MRKMNRKLISMLLSCVMAVTIMGTIVRAADETTSDEGYDSYTDSEETFIDLDAMEEVGIQLGEEGSQSGKTNGNVVVVIDAGHCPLHPGAAGNGLREEELTLKIAKYCKEELSKYENVTVYMTREDGSCLNTSSSSACLSARSTYAASVQADLLVSMHVDAGSSNSSGAMVIVAKKGIYRDDIASVTQNAGNSILKELTTLGLSSRGLYVRMSDSKSSEYYYENGATADYYSITRNCMKNGIPGIIVEHGFITNASDVAKFLNSDEKLKALGVADATGIANYFHLSKKGDISIADAMWNDSSDPYEITEDDTIADFIANLYLNVLGRTPAQSEVSSWLNQVNQKQMTGGDLVKGFTNSQEFLGRNYSNEDYVECLYHVYLNRASDLQGKAMWVRKLEEGATRNQVADGFAGSVEFGEYCARYGVAQGGYSMQYTKLYPKIAEFVSEYYRGLLYREPDEQGLENWTRKMIQGSTAAELTKGFINSQEFKNHEIDRSDFVERLYLTYLNRASDPQGKANWEAKLPTMSYEEKIQVIRGFLGSQEYKQHCAQYGIKVGSL